MKLKTALLAILLLSAAGLSGICSAHTTGAQTLGPTLAAKDVYVTHCFSHGSAAFTPGAPAGEVNGAANKFRAALLAGSSANTRVQAFGLGSNGGVAAPGAASQSNTGNGLHAFVVTHTTAVASAYNVEFKCRNGVTSAALPNGQETGAGNNFGGVPPNVSPAVDFVQTLNQ